jgi:hypothetical protein
MLNNCEIVLYAGKKPRVNVVYRRTVLFDISVLSTFVTGKISKDDLIAYRMNTIDEYCSDVYELIANKCFINPQLYVECKSNFDEDNSETLFETLCKTEKETNKYELQEKLRKYELY